jgi:hypothetical protein
VLVDVVVVAGAVVEVVVDVSGGEVEEVGGTVTVVVVAGCDVLVEGCVVAGAVDGGTLVVVDDGTSCSQW